MSFDTPPPEPAPKRRPGLKVALIGAGVIAGAIGATAFGASAATTNGSGSSAASSAASSSSSSTQAQAPAPGHRPGDQRGPGGAKPVRSDEKSVTSNQEAKLKAAALKAVPGGTVIRVETDAGDGAYEAHMKKADGTLVTVKFDKNLAVTGVESGMGKGDPAPAGH
jgi:uncharacterized membrane protein YkoI